MEIYVIDEEGNVKERYSNIEIKYGFSILKGIMRFNYQHYQISKEEQKKFQWLRYIEGDYINPQEAPFQTEEIDLTKEKRVEIVR